ncbi:serine protease [Streptomyces sp. NRRL S-31]|uniref:S1 family peptidase n=1 Tax=Streptomyces sp. NRRL S-31 TaxID=1463898 RepID=UPI0004CBC4A4|nr:serine protease [Streptomyces sp. NRRL S-31]
MAGRGPRTGDGRREREEQADGGRGHGDRAHARPGRGQRPYGESAYGEGPYGGPGTATAAPAAAPPAGSGVDPALVHIRDLTGRPRGLGFLADHEGTLLTSHEAVDGLPRLVLHTTGDHTRVVTADAVTPLPHLNLALVRTEGLGVRPLPLTARERIDAGSYVRIAAGCWREARVLAATQVTYTAADRSHRLADALELAIGTAGRDALRTGGGAAGGPVLDADTGAVVGVLGTALHTEQRDTGFAVPLRPADGALTVLLARNAATVPAYGADLNLAGVLRLTAATAGRQGHESAVEPVERTGIARELAAFADGDRPVLGLVGAPGSGRTTELAALAARRARGDRPAPTLWLRGADLADADDSVADAARRALARAARTVAASRAVRPEDLGDITPDRLAGFAARAGRPLLLLLDGPEEMPAALAHRLADWTRATADWLRLTGCRLVVSCREELWEHAGRAFPDGLLHTPALLPAPAGPGTPVGDGGAVGGRAASGVPAEPGGAESGAGSGAAGAGPSAADPDGAGMPIGAGMPVGGDGQDGRDGQGGGTAGPGDQPPPCLRVGDLTAEEARRARQRYGIPDGALVEPDARHPLTLRLLAEVRAAAPAAPAAGPLDRYDVFAAHLDLTCLRVAVRLAAADGPHGTAVRRLAVRVAGQVHEAARRSLGPGQGALDRESFEALFPRGPAPARLGGRTGWAHAVLAEGLLVPAGDGYRFAHEDLADWIQGLHLDLDEALRALVHRPVERRVTPGPVPVPHHRIGPVVQALLLLPRRHGTRQLGVRLQELTEALDHDTGSWWAARLLARTLLRVPDALPYAEVLRLLADRIVAWRRARRPVPAEFGPAFWTALPLPGAERLDLLRRLVLADPAPPAAGDRHLDAVAGLLAAAPGTVQPLLTAWFADERPLPATPHATVATAAQALLHTHRHGALDDLTEALVACAHRRADELLGVLAEEEPSAVCRAVDRWAHDERPARRAAAVAWALRAAPHARSDADRELLRHTARTLLARPADHTLHGGALAVLVHDPHTRDQHLPAALRHFADGDPRFPPTGLAPALATHPEPVLEAVRARLRAPDAGGAEAGATLRGLAGATTPALAGRVAALVRQAVRRRPDTAGHIAAQVGDRLAHGPTARPVLLPLVTGLLDGGPEQLRAALATVLAAAGPPASRPLRRELLEHLLAEERDPSVLDAVLHAAAGPGHGCADEVRGLVRRVGLLLVRTPEGAARLDRGLVDLGRHVPGFAARMARWLADAPDDWAAVVGPGTRRTIENLADARVPA